MKKQNMEINFLDKVLNHDTFGVPRTPSRWVTAPTYLNVIRVHMTNGTQIIKGDRTTLETIQESALAGNPVIATTYNGKTIYLNAAYIISAEPLTIVERVLHSDNWNFQIGDYVCRWLIPEGKTVTFCNSFDSVY